VYRGLEDLTYPFHVHCGRICFNRRKINPSQVFAGQNVRVTTQVGERIWLVTFMDYDLGYFDDETGPPRTDRESLRAVLPMCSE
jgi:putative transposase